MKICSTDTEHGQEVTIPPHNIPCDQWRAVHGSKGSIASIVKKRKENNSYINNSI
jgi:hypothetical protein